MSVQTHTSFVLMTLCSESERHQPPISGHLIGVEQQACIISESVAAGYRCNKTILLFDL
jgi:hypothetical protein